MGLDYALVHLWWNIPPALLLTFVYYPLFTRLDIYKICFLISVAFTATIPWDSYLIRSNVWSYPDDAVLGPTLFDIPIEELFFFVIQTYNTSLLYCLLSKSTFHAVYLRGKHGNHSLLALKWTGSAIITALIALGVVFLQRHGEGFYMGLILAWAGPFVLLLWMLAYQFILGLPWKDTVVPIVLPTLYLWLVDTLALRRGTWVIEQGTKLNWQLWEGLEIEEAVFFLATNVMIVFGLLAFDNAMAVLDTFTNLFPRLPTLSSPVMMVCALLLPTSSYDEGRIQGLQQALARLCVKSRSFSIASGVFPGRVRADLVLLYSFCRIADDLVDEATSLAEARKMTSRLRIYLDRAYAARKTSNELSLQTYITASFPARAHQALFRLPTEHLISKPLYSLLDGFEMDLDFSDGKFPIRTDADLELYAERVAGTVAEMCLRLVYYHHGLPDATTNSQKSHDQVIDSGNKMGVALQLVNIARDIQTDARMGRVYVPATWLKNHGLEPRDLINSYKDNATSPTFVVKIEAIRRDLLDWAMKLYRETRPDIENLPIEARGGVRVMVESYVEIGRVILEHGGRERDWGVKGRATVPGPRRLLVAWKAMVAP